MTTEGKRMTTKPIDAICPVCNVNVRPTRRSLKGDVVYRCTDCGAFAHSYRNFTDGYIDKFVTHDCSDSCKRRLEKKCDTEDSLAMYCPHAEVLPNNCLKEKCCHFPCCHDCIPHDSLLELCPIVQAPFEQTVTHLLIAILRELKNNNHS